MDECILKGFVPEQGTVIPQSCHVEARSHIVPVREADSDGRQDGDNPEQDKE